jgi:hypothetical protein
MAAGVTDRVWDVADIVAIIEVAEPARAKANGRFWQILLQKSPRRSCEIEMRNNRIRIVRFANQRCAFAPDLESILLAQLSKILLQQYRH